MSHNGIDFRAGETPEEKTGYSGCEREDRVVDLGEVCSEIPFPILGFDWNDFQGYFMSDGLDGTCIEESGCKAGAACNRNLEDVVCRFIVEIGVGVPTALIGTHVKDVAAP